MDVKDLKYAVASYEAGIFSGAAKVLGTVRLNASLRMRNLEDVLGVSPFERPSKRPADRVGRSALPLRQAGRRSAARNQARARAPADPRAGTSRGFTLLELLVVVVIIGLLAGYVAPKYFSQVGKSEVQLARAQMDAFEKALDQYRLDTRRYPSTEQGLKALVERPSSEMQWNGPYLRKAVPLDPWGRPYVYRAPGARGEYDLMSYGKDGQPGGSGENADIVNY